MACQVMRPTVWKLLASGQPMCASTSAPRLQNLQRKKDELSACDHLSSSTTMIELSSRSLVAPFPMAEMLRQLWKRRGIFEARIAFSFLSIDIFHRAASFAFRFLFCSSRGHRGPQRACWENVYEKIDTSNGIRVV